MTRFNQSQLADLNARAGAVLTTIRGHMLRQEFTGDAKQLLRDLGDLALVYGRPGMAHAVRYWCDAVIAATPGAVVGRPVEVRFATPDQEELVSQRYIIPERKWAADVLAARFAGDHVRLYDLVDQLPRDRMALLHLYRMAEIAAGFLNHYDAPTTTGPYAPGLYRATPDGRLQRRQVPS
jgi:hypothetical protein